MPKILLTESIEVELGGISIIQFTIAYKKCFPISNSTDYFIFCMNFIFAKILQMFVLFIYLTLTESIG